MKMNDQTLIKLLKELKEAKEERRILNKQIKETNDLIDKIVSQYERHK